MILLRRSPEEEADKEDPTISGILKATSHVDITKSKTTTQDEPHASGDDQPQPPRKQLSFAQTAAKEDIIKGGDIFEIWLCPIDEGAQGTVEKSAVNVAQIFNTSDRNSAAGKIMNMSVEPVPKTRRTFSVICATPAVAIDLKLALDEEGLKVPTVEGGSMMYFTRPSTRPDPQAQR